jgi:multimeric flavodoxin WrbA
VVSSGKPYILGVAGSPRRHGNSERLLDACLEGVKAGGAEARKLAVVEYGLSPCQGCNACSLTGECVLRDRMAEVYPLLDGASAIVVGSPVYFATVPAVLKALYDRCQPYWARRYVLKLPAPPARPGALLLAHAGGDPYGADAAVTTTRSVFAALGLEYTASYEIVGVDSPSDIGRHPEAFERAAAIGLDLAARAVRAGSG